MQKVIKSNEFIEFKNYLSKVIKKINDVKNDVNVDVKLKYNLDKYNKIVEGSDSDVLTQYETWYDQLAKVVINNNNTIQQSNEAKEQLNELVEFIINSKVNDNMDEIFNKEKKNNNLLKETLNSVVDKMIDKETIIFNKNEDELKRQANQRKHEFDEKLQNINQMKYQLDVVTIPIEKLFPNDTRIQQDKEIVELKDSGCGVFASLDSMSDKPPDHYINQTEIPITYSNQLISEHYPPRQYPFQHNYQFQPLLNPSQNNFQFQPLLNQSQSQLPEQLELLQNLGTKFDLFQEMILEQFENVNKKIEQISPIEGKEKSNKQQKLVQRKYKEPSENKTNNDARIEKFNLDAIKKRLEENKIDNESILSKYKDLNDDDELKRKSRNEQLITIRNYTADEYETKRSVKLRILDIAAFTGLNEYQIRGVYRREKEKEKAKENGTPIKQAGKEPLVNIEEQKEIVKLITLTENNPMRSRTMTGVVNVLLDKDYTKDQMRNICKQLNGVNYSIKEGMQDYFDRAVQLINGVKLIGFDPGLVLNVDESGFCDKSDYKQQKCSVPSYSTNPHIPIDHSSRKFTLVTGVSASGQLLKPMIICKRKTIDNSIYRNVSMDSFALSIKIMLT
ncbi:hypothetical protein QTN25_002450 [Entamoeba marina]